jgi:hypothetical protein
VAAMIAVAGMSGCGGGGSAFAPTVTEMASQTSPPDVVETPSAPTTAPTTETGTTGSVQIQLPGPSRGLRDEIYLYVVVLSDKLEKDHYEKGEPGKLITFREIPVGPFSLKVYGQQKNGTEVAFGETKGTVQGNLTITARVTLQRTTGNVSLAVFLEDEAGLGLLWVYIDNSAELEKQGITHYRLTLTDSNPDRIREWVFEAPWSPTEFVVDPNRPYYEGNHSISYLVEIYRGNPASGTLVDYQSGTQWVAPDTRQNLHLTCLSF